MARIKWVNHPYKPELNGTIEHVARELATVAVGYGQAEDCPAPNYQTRLAENELERQRNLQPDPNFVQGVSWTVKEHTLAAAGQGRAFIERRCGNEVLYGESPDAFKDCPKNIRVRFLELNKVEDPDAVAEKQIKERYRLEAEQKKQRELEAGGMYRHGLVQRT
jgi:hypothetical protein